MLNLPLNSCFCVSEILSDIIMLAPSIKQFIKFICSTPKLFDSKSTGPYHYFRPNFVELQT